MPTGKISFKYDDKMDYPFLLRSKGSGQDLIFVHIPKTAGTSISRALNFPLPQPLLKIRKHYTASAIRDFLPAGIWDNAYKFAFVRNPWERLFSHYQYRKSRKKVNITGGVEEDFNSWVSKNIPEDKPGNLQPQLDWITDMDQRLLVDFVGHFDQLNDDIQRLYSHLDLTFPKLDHLNSSGERLDYRLLYNEETRKLVGDFYREDIRYFEFSF